MKKSIKIAIILILLIIYIYIYNIAVIPNNVILFEGDKLNLKMVTGLSLTTNGSNYQTALASSNLNKQSINQVGNNNANLNLFGNIKVKNVNVSVIPTTKVIPLGTAIGMKLYTKGVLVVGMSELETQDNDKVKPYENSGIEEGDSIIAVNNKEVSNTNELIKQVNSSNGEPVKIEYLKDNNVLETNIKPVKTKDNYQLGLWVRDAAAGIGTLTFYEPSTNMFMSLGHGIVDIDTGDIVDISTGQLVTANILSIVKGQRDIPGEIRGTVSGGNTIGQIYKNTKLGVYGSVSNKQYLSENSQPELEVAQRSEIKEGKATIRCQLDNSAPQDYEIQIEKIYLDNNSDNKSMLIKITDKNLLDKTNGIIQGMSGAPIIQNGKFIGAVTNVLVKDPTQGYAVFGDILIKQMRETGN